MKSEKRNFTREQRAIIESAISNAKSRILSDEKIKDATKKKEFRETIDRTFENIKKSNEKKEL